MKLLWTKIALNDRHLIYDFIEAKNPSAAINLDILITEKAALLLQNPKIGRLGRILNTFELVIHKHYVLIYDVQNSTIRILRLLHCAKQFPSA